MSDCLFCRIVEGDVSTERVAESARALAFRDIEPKAPTHVLVIPKTHIANIHVAAPEHGLDIMSVMLLAQQVAQHEGLVERSAPQL